MSQQELLTRVVSALESLGIQYMITGAVASSMHGEPRLTHDIDFVVVLDEPDAERLAGEFHHERYYLDEVSILGAIEERGMFNLVDADEGGRIDFWMLTYGPFDRSRFARRRTERFLDMELVISSPEDTILQKLRWARLSGGSEKQFTDALRVYEVQHENLDQDYLDLWASKLEVRQLLDRMREEASVP